jgi:hypothetical protein
MAWNQSDGKHTPLFLGVVESYDMDITGKSRTDVTRTGTIDPADVIYILRVLSNKSEVDK